ncbi:methyltransferase domain-containing protein [Pseudonocardia ailaonensis]|uniref:Methyltransferase domain-containing protein n=1 Tax=Pseudonocardia ailaonensis TaxID=367279 RepID=A0ABN2N2E6_9PSEU
MDAATPEGTTAGYTIRGGRTDADRLARQAEVMASASLDFLAGCGARPGAAVLDVGCGDGQVALALARLVGPGGRVLGVDVDPEAVAIARRTPAAVAGLDVTFRTGDASVPAGADEFDLAYARLLLSHLVDPMAVVRALRTAVRPGGVVAVEDLFTPALAAEPRVPALDDLADIYSATVRGHGGDPAIGPRLAAHLAAAGLVDVTERTVVNRMTTVGEKLFLVQLLENMRPAILAARSATDVEITRVVDAVSEAAARPDVTFLQARMHQVAGRRPGTP